MNKLILIIYALLQLFAIPVSSQNSLSGTILIMETGLPLTGAIVYFPELMQGTVSNSDGKFKINNLPMGTFLVEIKNIGFNSYVNYEKINGAVYLDVKLAESAVEMNEVLVTGSVFSTQRFLNPIPVSSISRQELSRSSSSNIIDVLTNIPGISQISTGSSISKPVIRGLGYNRVLVLHDDIRQEGQQWGDEHGIEIDENSIDKVEIIKGPGSLIYGSDALAGVINFISTPSLPEGIIKGNISSVYQSNNRMMEYSALNQGNLNGFNWLIRGTYKLAGNFRNNYDKKVYNSGFEEKNLNGYLGLTKKWGYTFLRISSFNHDLGIIEGDRDISGRFLTFVANEDGSVYESPVSSEKLNSYTIDIPKQTIHHYRVQLNSKLILGKSNLQTDLGFQKNIRKEYADPAMPDLAELNFILNTFNYAVKFNFPALYNWRSIAGINGMVQANTNEGEEQLIPDYHLNDIGFFLTTQKTWNKFHFSTGIRIDNRFLGAESLIKEGIDNPASSEDYKFEGFNKNFANASFGIGISRNISTSAILKVNFSKGFRAPNLAELATNGKHEGTFRYEIGNKNLRSEVSNQIDAGMVFNTHHLNFEVNTFLNNVRNFIYISKLANVSGSDSIPDPFDPSPAFIFKQGSAFLYGGEVNLDIHPHPFDFLHLQQTFSYVRGKMRHQSDSTRNLSFIPPAQYKAEIRIQPAKFKMLKNPYVLMEYKYFFPQKNVFTAFGTETPTSGYGLLNFGVGTEIRSPGNITLAAIHFEIANLLNTTYQNHLSRLKYAPSNPATGRHGIFNAGRNFTIKLEIPLTIKEKTSL